MENTEIKEMCIKKNITFTVVRVNSPKPFIFKDILSYNPLPEDEVSVEFVEAFYSENESWESHYCLRIIRVREETDEECVKRIQRAEVDKEFLRKRRYENFLVLKKEFEEINLDNK